MRGIDARIQHGFQSTRPHGARPDQRVDAAKGVYVSIHAPAWGATFKTSFTYKTSGFNPRARMGRDFNSFYYRCYCIVVSIHAPAWGATVVVGFVEHVFVVSIHAPAWGATCLHFGRTLSNSCFNPRARMGRDGAEMP